ncbi:hypothetical protein F66182_6148 [Fusarium sp. NRRL 66182]|nr:hypothetical protein F66182_6148 [Fusarium sp. NRRL 66182]
MASSDKNDIPVTNEGMGKPLSSKNQVLTAGAAVTQEFRPVKHICAHLNAFHAYADDPSRFVETNHYCAHLKERKLWHSHVYEVKSGMLIMPNRAIPEAAWQVAENYEMEQVVYLYGKVYHLWQTDRGDTLPLGPPKLMTSFTADGQFDLEKHVGERDRRFGTDYKAKKEARKDIPTPAIHRDADQAWNKDD